YRDWSSDVCSSDLPFLIQLGTGDGVDLGGGLEATRWAGGDAAVAVGNLKLARFVSTLSRVPTFIGCCCSMAAIAAASWSMCADPIRRNCCQIGCSLT